MTVTLVTSPSDALNAADRKPLEGLRAESPLDAKTFLAIRRRAELDGCKWDSQVGDVATLADFPLVMKRSEWKRLAAQAEQLAAEAAAAEEEILRQPTLVRRLGLPRTLENVLTDGAPETPAPGRVIRFDFHFTTEGWRISEANSDVPGGFTEASHFTSMIAGYYPALQPAGDPAGAWIETLANAAGERGVVALLSAAGYMEDHQIVAFLAARLRMLGRQAHLAKPEQIQWRAGVAHLDTAWHRGPLDAIVRFYQAEWLSRLPMETGWTYFFRGGKTLVANPMLAVISESKRFPLLWDDLTTELPAWRALLPETRDPRDAPWSSSDAWLLKSAMSNTGDTVSIRELMRPKDWLETRFRAFLTPGGWVAQRRFNSVPVPTPDGPRHVCVGVYTVNGRTAGAYVRLSEKPLIDFAAVDVALLLEDDD